MWIKHVIYIIATLHKVEDYTAGGNPVNKMATQGIQTSTEWEYFSMQALKSSARYDGTTDGLHKAGDLCLCLSVALTSKLSLSLASF